MTGRNRVNVATQAINKGCFLGASPPKQVLAPTGRNSFLFPPTTCISYLLQWPPTTCRRCFMGAREGGWWGSEARLRGHHRRQECRRSVGWATLLSPLLHGSLPTKTSFGADGKKQLVRPTNDLQKLFHGRGWMVGERSTPSWQPSATGVSPVRRMGDTLVAPAAWEPPLQNKFWPRREEIAFFSHQRLAEAVF